MTNGAPVDPHSRATVDYSEFGPIERRPLGKLQRLTAQLLTRSWATIPQVTQHDEIDITDFEMRRRSWNTLNPDHKVTPVAAVAKSVAMALQTHPRFNCSLEADGQTVVQKHYYNIGIAIETPNGLLVGVIRDAAAKSIVTIGAEMSALAAKARARGLSMSEMTGGSMTVSSLGHIGGTGFTPIINAPEVAILGVSKTQIRPLPAPEGRISWRNMLPLSLSYDHRLINGADAARFILEIETRLRQMSVFDG